jgi:Fe-S cluster assembly protein SufD
VTTTEREVSLAPTGSPAERFTSRDPEAFEMPRGREEAWRFTPIRRLRPFLEGVAADPDAAVRGADTPAPVTIRPIAPGDPLWGITARPSDRAAAVAWQQASTGRAVQIPADATVVEPIVLTVDGVAGKRDYGHLVIDAGPHSSAVLVIEHTGGGEHATNVEVRVGDGARLDVVAVQRWDDDAVHLGWYDAVLGRDATYRHITVNLGGGLVRLAPTVRFAGPGGDAQLLGVSFAGSASHFESRLYIDHGVPDCRSDVLYKNALLGETARTVWIGDVRIRPEATGTSTYEMNRNLLLSDGARADSVPNLEIETGEIVGAGHASATGRFDDLQLFYLMSRGIDAEHAQRLVVRGFFADVVDRIGLPDLQHRIMTAVEARLGFTPDQAETPDTELEQQ